MSKIRELSLSGRFYRMRDNWIRHVIRLSKDELSVAEKVVAVYIAEAINPDTRSWVVSQDKIARELGLKIRVVKKGVSELKKLGLLDATRVPVPGQSKLFNAYELVPVELAEPD